MRRLILIVGGVAIVVAILGVYIASSGLFSVYRAPQTPMPSPTTPAPATVPVREIVVELGDYYFKPQSIVIRLGETARFVLNNVGKASHTFTIDELGIDVRLAPGRRGPWRSRLAGLEASPSIAYLTGVSVWLGI